MSRSPDASPGGAQTVHRALDVLEAVESAGRDMSIADIAAALRLPAPTVHRLCRALVDRGYMRQLADRRYTLGMRLMPLGNAANQLIGVDATSVLADLVAETGETANLAVLAGHQAEYVAQVPSGYTMRMFTEVGRRVDLHSTGVGKVLLSRLPRATVEAIVRRPLVARTPHTITNATALEAELERIRQAGFALDEQEQEIGVRCVAAPVGDELPWMALSISGPLPRMSDELVQRAIPLLHSGARRLAESLATNKTDS
ncbi:IclR family transcriptional regulator [Nocardioides sp. CCNWLW239]|uniref:IclR family transcriptional regulator n=1 Tax=Nocardioides sp. CCNWLW239 TaxID=3128902 RepID=UPI003015BFED